MAWFKWKIAMLNPFSSMFGWNSVCIPLLKSNRFYWSIVGIVKTERCYPCLVFPASRYMFLQSGFQPGRSELTQRRKEVEELGRGGTVLSECYVLLFLHKSHNNDSIIYLITSHLNAIPVFQISPNRVGIIWKKQCLVSLVLKCYIFFLKIRTCFRILA